MSWKGETHWTTRPKGRISAATFSQKECPRYSLHYFLLKYLLICYTNLRCLSSGENMIHLEYFNLYSAKFSLDIMLCSASAVWVIFKESEQSGYAKHLRTTGVDLQPGGIMLWRSVYVCSPPAPSSPVQCFYHHHNYYNANIFNYITCMVPVRIMLWLSQYSLHTIFTIFYQWVQSYIGQMWFTAEHAVHVGPWAKTLTLVQWPNVVHYGFMHTTSCSALPPRYCIVTICMVQVGIMLWPS